MPTRHETLVRQPSVIQHGGLQGQEVGSAPDKDDVALCNMLVGVCGKEEIAAPCLFYDLEQAWLVDWKLLDASTCTNASSEALSSPQVDRGK